MKKITAVLITLIALFIAACDNEGGGNFGEPKDDHIASIAEQRIAIDNSITELRGALSAIKGANILRANADSVTTRAQSTDYEEINDKISALEIQTDTLQAYIDTIDVDDDWYETTCNTLNIYEQTLQKLVALQIEVKELKENDKALESKLTEIEKRITACAVSMESWVNNQLTGYYDIATIDGLLTEIKAETTAADSIISQEIKELDTKLETSNQEMTIAYQEAIKEAIEENNGLLAEAAQKAIETINKRIDDAIAGINSRIDDIEKRLSKLEDAVKDLLNRIQSISFIPLYEDETAVVKYPEEGTTKGSTLRMDFLLSPKNTVSDIAKYYDKVLAVKAAYLGSTNFINLPIIECTANAEQGILTLTAATDSLSMDFLNGKVNARAMLFISDGNNDLTSDYIPLSTISSSPIENCIYYTTTDNKPINFGNNIFDSNIVSNTYSQKTEQFVLTFNNNVTAINANIFSDKLESIYLPDGLRSINGTFYCKNLTTIRMPKNVSLNATFLSECPMITFTGTTASKDGRCYITNGVLKCFSPGELTEYTIPDNVTTIGIEAFKNMDKLVSITIPKSVTSIEHNAFQGCTGLKTVNTDNIENWFSIEFLSEESNPTYYTKSLNVDGNPLTEFITPDNITEINNYTFYNCTEITSITIPNSVTSIGTNAFSGCSGLKTVKIDCETIEAWFNNNPSIENIIIGDNVKNISHRAFSGCTGITNITIPDNVTNIGDYAFEGCKELTEITIPNSITNIGGATFRDCTGLTNIEIPNSVTSIGTDAFSNCTGLINIEIPNSVTSIGSGAFSGCTGFTSITIPKNITNIGEKAFSACTGIKSIIVEEGNNTYDSRENCNAIIETASNALITGCKNSIIPNGTKEIRNAAFFDLSNLKGRITIPNTVTHIGDYAFYNCERLFGITIPDCIQYIGSYAFSGCALSEIIIPNQPELGEYVFDNCNLRRIELDYTYITDDIQLGLSPTTEVISVVGYNSTSIKDGEFRGCEEIQGIKIANSVTSIGNSAFEGCSGLKSVTIPNSVTSIGELAFGGCTNLWSIKIPNSVTSIGENAFRSCESLGSVTLPDNITTIEYGTFVGCYQLWGIKIPNSVTSIGDNAFCECTGLTEITIPNSVTSIAHYAFGGCLGLETIYMQSTTPPETESSAFDRCNITTLYVPQKSQKAYKFHSVYGKYPIQAMQ